MVKDSKIYPWNQLLDWYLEGNQLPFLDVFKFIVVNHRFFRNKNFGELIQNFDTEPEDFFQDLCLQLDRLFYPQRWKIQELSDSHLNNTIRKFIRDKLIDLIRRKIKLGKNVALEDLTELSIQPQTQEQLERQEQLKLNESKIIQAIKRKLSNRQAVVLQEYHVFKIGNKGREILASELRVSIKTIELDIRKIKDVVEEEYMNRFPYLKKYSKKQRGLYERV